VGGGGARTPWVRLESTLPAALAAGSASAIYVSGTAMDGDRPPRGLTLLIDGAPRRVARIAMPRFDVPERRGGFWATVAVRVPAGATEVLVQAQTLGRDGPSEPIELARVPVTRNHDRAQIADEPDRAGQRALGGGDPIAICMATHQPDPELLRAQLESIRAQTDEDWTCVISDDCSEPDRYQEIVRLVGDDRRFSVSRAPEWIGFYRNFERALRLAPRDARLIALSDQDDVWHPDKLATLRASIGDAPLVYSDQRLVDPDGRVLRETMWVGRSNNRTNMASMLVANTVTGAAALIRRDVVERALPFPDCPGIEFHDHWLALVALATGRLRYVDRPLYDYVQHPDAILGRVIGPDASARRRRDWRPRAPRLRAPRLREWRGAYFLGYLPGQMRAQTLLMRCGDTLAPSDRRALGLYLRADRSPRAFLWFVTRPARMLLGRTETRGGEAELAVGIVWEWLATLVARAPGWPDRYLLDTSFPDQLSFAQKRLGRWRRRI
jgi:glycosyltransferase involved in cell wall biosynthesis